MINANILTLIEILIEHNLNTTGNLFLDFIVAITVVLQIIRGFNKSYNTKYNLSPYPIPSEIIIKGDVNIFNQYDNDNKEDDFSNPPENPTPAPDPINHIEYNNCNIYNIKINKPQNE